MPREYAKNRYQTWTDDEFVARPVFDKLLWVVLRGQPATLLNNCGVQPLSLRRWCRAMADGDTPAAEADVLAALYRMEADGLVCVDETADVVLDMTMMLDDELDKQPTVLLNALRFAAMVESPKIAAALLDIFTTALKAPDITADTPYAVKLRKAMNAAYEATLTHLRGLAARHTPGGSTRPSTRPSPGGSPRPSPGDSPGGSSRPAETGGSPGGSTGGSPRPPVVVEVEVVNSPSGVTQGGGNRPHCQIHPNGNPTDTPCRGCAAGRHWDETQAARAQANAEATARRHAAQAAHAAILDCELCDQDGYIGTRVCDHTDRTHTHQTGIAQARAALTRQEPTSA